MSTQRQYFCVHCGEQIRCAEITLQWTHISGYFTCNCRSAATGQYEVAELGTTAEWTEDGYAFNYTQDAPASEFAPQFKQYASMEDALLDEESEVIVVAMRDTLVVRAYPPGTRAIEIYGEYVLGLYEN